MPFLIEIDSQICILRHPIVVKMITICEDEIRLNTEQGSGWDRLNSTFRPYVLH